MIIHNFKRLEDKGCKIAEFSCEVPAKGERPGQIYNYMALIESKGKRWVAIATRCEEDATGKKRFVPYSAYTDEKINRAFLDKVLDEVEKVMQQQPVEKEDAIVIDEVPF